MLFKCKGVNYLIIIMLKQTDVINVAYSEQLSMVKLETLVKEATNGDVKSQIRLGYLYEEGKSVKQDFKIAFQWYFKASQNGDALAQWHCGLMCESGKGVLKDYNEAMKWYRKSADQGYSPSLYNMGVLYENGRGVEVSYTEAMKWYKNAADQGDEKAKIKYDEIYKVMMKSISDAFNNKTVTKSDIIEYQELLSAAQKGDVNSQLKIAGMFRYGKGVTKNISEAIKWYQKAVENGSEEGKKQLAILINDTMVSYVEPSEDINEIKDDKIRKKLKKDPTVIYEDMKGSVVIILTKDDDNNSLGSGFFISDGMIITNEHVISGAKYGYARIVNQKEKIMPITIINCNKKIDVAILKVPITKKYKLLPLADVSKLLIGEKLYALGNPLGQEGTFSDGIVSRLEKNDKGEVIEIQTNTAISPGSSGGPVVDSEGNVVGIVVSYLRESQNINFVIPISIIKKYMSESGIK